MSGHLDAIIFIDRREAKVFHIGAENEPKLVITHASALRRHHHQADHEDGTKQDTDDEFMQRIAGSLELSLNTLICGPGNSKYELQSYIRQHTPQPAQRVSRLENLDDSKDRGILARGRRLFRKRSHRHQIEPRPGSRHFDVPFKS